MDKLQKTIILISDMERVEDRQKSLFDTRALLIVTVLYLVAMLSISLYNVTGLLLFALFPIINANLCGLKYSYILLHSLVIVPIVAVFVIFNPIYDATPIAIAPGLTIRAGWISFATVIIRGVLAFQALLIVISSKGMYDICNALSRLKVPTILTVQLQLTVRYMRLLLEELQTMQRARAARGYGRKHLSLKMWATLIGQLFIRTVDRSQRITAAMKSRGFTGTIPHFSSYDSRWYLRDSIYTISFSLLFLFLTIFNF